MSRLLLLAALAALAAAAARAEEPVLSPDPRLFAEPTVDASPTPYACTVESLAAGTRCVFESEAGPAPEPVRQAVDNARAAAKLAASLCAAATRHPQEPIPDPEVLAACERAFTEKATACGADGARPLLDEGGRFAKEFRLCYAAMAEILARARLMAASSGPCCRCLLAARCVASAARCNAQPFAAGAGGACAVDSCREACGAFLPAAPPPQPEVTRARPGLDPPVPCSDPLRLEAPCVRQ
jgi:hypothetical protein